MKLIFHHLLDVIANKKAIWLQTVDIEAVIKLKFAVKIVIMKVDLLRTSLLCVKNGDSHNKAGSSAGRPIVLHVQNTY